MNQEQLAKYLQELNKPTVEVKTFEQNLRRVLLNYEEPVQKSFWSFPFYKIGLALSSVVSMILIIALVVNISPALTIDQIIAKALVADEQKSVGKEYRQINSKVTYFDGTNYHEYNLKGVFYFPENNEPEPTINLENQDFSAPYTAGMPLIIQIEDIYFQVNERFFKKEGYEIGSNPESDNIGFETYSEETLQQFIEHLYSRGYVEITKEQMNQEIRAYVAKATEEQAGNPDQYYDVWENYTGDSCGTNDGGRVFIDCYGEFYIQLIPDPSWGLADDFFGMSQEERRNYLRTVAFREVTLEQGRKLHEYDPSPANLVYAMTYGFSYAQDPYEIFTQIKELPDVTIIENPPAENLIGIKFSTTYLQESFVTEVYFDLETFEPKLIRELDSSNVEIIKIEITEITYY